MEVTPDVGNASEGKEEDGGDKGSGRGRPNGRYRRNRKLLVNGRNEYVEARGKVFLFEMD